MKNFTLVLIALITGTTFAQNSDLATANASAEIISAITISKTTDMDFGMVANNATTGGTVILDNAATTGRTGSADIITASAFQNAVFTINAENLYTYSISLPTSNITLSDGGTNTMTVNGFNDNLGGSSTGTSADQTLYVGATLNVGANQAVGNYTGTFDVSVNYN